MKELFQKRLQLDEDNPFELYKFWDEINAYIIRHPEETLNYLNHPCSSEEFVFFSEIIDDILINTDDYRFLEGMKRLCDIYPEEANKYNIVSILKDLEE